MILTLSPSRFDDLLTPDQVRLDPPVPAHTYHDNSGNFCDVIRAPQEGLPCPRTFLSRTAVSLTQSRREPSSTHSKTCRWRSWSICSVAATARPIAYRIRHGHS